MFNFKKLVLFFLYAGLFLCTASKAMDQNEQLKNLEWQRDNLEGILLQTSQEEKALNQGFLRHRIVLQKEGSGGFDLAYFNHLQTQIEQETFSGFKDELAKVNKEIAELQRKNSCFKRFLKLLLFKKINKTS